MLPLKVPLLYRCCTAARTACRYGFFYILLVGSAFADVAVTRLDAKLHAVSREWPVSSCAVSQSRVWTPTSTPGRGSSADSRQPSRRTLPGQPRHLSETPFFNSRGCPVCLQHRTRQRHSSPPQPPAPQPHTVTHVCTAPPLTADLCAAQLLAVLQRTSQLMQDTSEVVAIIFA